MKPFPQPVYIHRPCANLLCRAVLPLVDLVERDGELFCPDCAAEREDEEEIRGLDLRFFWLIVFVIGALLTFVRWRP